MKKMLFILNPRSGTRKAAKILPDIISVFNRADYAVTVHITDGPGDCSRAAQMLSPGMDMVVCCGGDGTFNETVNGLLCSGADIPLGYIPAGSTNDYATSLKLPTDILAATRAIVEGEPHIYDVGKINERYFSYVASFGIFTRTSYATSQAMKNIFGHAAYLLSSISELTQLQAIPMELELDGEIISDSFLFGSISNSTCLGHVLSLDSHCVDMADGKLEVLLIRPPKDLLELSACIRGLQTQRYDNRMITFRSVRQLRVTCPQGLCWTLDGERFEAPEHLQIDNIHHAIRLVQKG